MVPPPRRSRPRLAGLCVAALGVVVLPPGTAAVGADAEARSILAANCVKCHGPTKQKGGVRADSRAGLVGKADSGLPAVVPGKSGSSELIRRVTATDATLRMPPDGPAL